MKPKKIHFDCGLTHDNELKYIACKKNPVGFHVDTRQILFYRVDYESKCKKCLRSAPYIFYSILAENEHCVKFFSNKILMVYSSNTFSL